MLWDWLLWMEWEPWSVCGGRPVLWNFEKWHGDDKQCKKRTSGEISTRHALHKENESKYSTIQMQNKYNTRTMHNVLSHEYWWKGTSEGRDPLPIACFLLPFAFWHLSLVDLVVWNGDWWLMGHDLYYGPEATVRGPEAANSAVDTGNQEPSGAETPRGRKVRERGKSITKHLLVNHQPSRDPCFSRCSDSQPCYYCSSHFTQQYFCWPFIMHEFGLYPPSWPSVYSLLLSSD